MKEEGLDSHEGNPVQKGYFKTGLPKIVIMRRIIKSERSSKRRKSISVQTTFIYNEERPHFVIKLALCKGT